MRARRPPPLRTPSPPALPVRWACALVLAATGPAGAAPVQYTLDPTHSFVHFELLHFDTSTIRGRVGPLSGEVTLDRDAPGGPTGRVQLVIDLSKVSTGLGVLDARLKEPDLLDSAAQPQAFFVAEQFGFAPGGGVATVRGEFTLRGTSIPLTLKAQRFRCYFSPLFRREVCGGDFSAELPRSRFGITHSLPFVADTVTLQVQVEAIRQD